MLAGRSLRRTFAFGVVRQLFELRLASAEASADVDEREALPAGAPTAAQPLL